MHEGGFEERKPHVKGCRRAGKESAKAVADACPDCDWLAQAGHADVYCGDEVRRCAESTAGRSIMGTRNADEYKRGAGGMEMQESA